MIPEDVLNDLIFQLNLVDTKGVDQTAVRPDLENRLRDSRTLTVLCTRFNEQLGNIPWEDADRVHRLITEEIPAKVAVDTAYRNARENSDRQNARIEHDEALKRVMTAVLNDDMQLFKQFTDNEGFRRWLTDNVFGLTYAPPLAKNQTTVLD